MSMNRTPRKAGVVGGVLVAGAALLGSAAPALAGPGDAASPSVDPLTNVVGGALSSLPGSDSHDPDAPTPAPASPAVPSTGDPSEAHPLGVPVTGLINAVVNGASGLGPSSPYDAAAAHTAAAGGAGSKVIGQ